MAAASVPPVTRRVTVYPVDAAATGVGPSAAIAWETSGDERSVQGLRTAPAGPAATFHPRDTCHWLPRHAHDRHAAVWMEPTGTDDGVFAVRSAVLLRAHPAPAGAPAWEQQETPGQVFSWKHQPRWVRRCGPETTFSIRHSSCCATSWVLFEGRWSTQLSLFTQDSRIMKLQKAREPGEWILRNTDKSHAPMGMAGSPARPSQEPVGSSRSMWWHVKSRDVQVTAGDLPSCAEDFFIGPGGFTRGLSDAARSVLGLVTLQVPGVPDRFPSTFLPDLNHVKARLDDLSAYAAGHPFLDPTGRWARLAGHICIAPRDGLLTPAAYDEAVHNARIPWAMGLSGLHDVEAHVPMAFYAPETLATLGRHYLFASRPERAAAYDLFTGTAGIHLSGVAGSDPDRFLAVTRPETLGTLRRAGDVLVGPAHVEGLLAVFQREMSTCRAAHAELTALCEAMMVPGSPWRPRTSVRATVRHADLQTASGMPSTPRQPAPPPQDGHSMAPSNDGESTKHGG